MRCLDADALTSWFPSDVCVAYKRPTLSCVTPNASRASSAIRTVPFRSSSEARAHPRDEFGKQLLREVIEFARRYGLEHRVVFIEDFDLTMTGALAQASICG